MLATIREKLKGWKTIVVNGVIGLPALLLSILQSFDGVDISPLFGTYGAKVITAMAVAGILLRIITTGPVGGKGDAPPPASTKAGD